MREEPPPFDWPKNPAFAPVGWTQTWKLAEPPHPVQIEGYKRMSMTDKLRKMESLFAVAVALKTAQMRKRHPEWDEEKLVWEARREMMYGRR